MKRRLLTIIIAAIATTQMAVVNAQSNQQNRRTDGGWAAVARSGLTAPVGQPFTPQQNTQDAESVTIESQSVDPKKRLVGSWIVAVSPVGGTAFNSLQTYNEDGTMTETSTEPTIGPAHGVFEGETATLLSNLRVKFGVA